jgi:hypothetical protein
MFLSLIDSRIMLVSVCVFPSCLCLGQQLQSYCVVQVGQQAAGSVAATPPAAAPTAL